MSLGCVKNIFSWSSCFGPVGSVASLERWDTGLIPSPAQWVKDLVLPQLQHRSQLAQIWSLAEELQMLWGGQQWGKKFFSLSLLLFKNCWKYLILSLNIQSRKIELFPLSSLIATCHILLYALFSLPLCAFYSPSLWLDFEIQFFFVLKII